MASLVTATFKPNTQRIDTDPCQAQENDDGAERCKEGGCAAGLKNNQFIRRTKGSR